MTYDSPVVILYGPTWDAPSQMSKHHLARYWAEHRKVLFVEAPPNPLSFLTRPAEARRLLRRYLHGPIQAGESLWIKSYFYPLPYRGKKSVLGARWVNSLNQQVVRPQLRRLLRRLGFWRPIVVAGGAQALPLLDALSPRLVVYHCSDDYTAQEDFPYSFAQLEREFISRCDFVITTSEELRHAKSSLHPHVYTVPNGAEVEHFARTQDAQTPVAEELRGLPRPIVGYIGSLFEWLDQEMVAHAAAARPRWSFVLIGPASADLSLLRGRANVHLLGQRPYAELPRYLKGFDVATVPFVFHDVTLRASPIKFYEYLASGVPVVATRLPDFEPLAHLTHLVRSPEEFVAAIERAVDQDTPGARAARMAVAHRHSWASRFARIDCLIDDALATKGTPNTAGHRAGRFGR